MDEATHLFSRGADTFSSREIRDAIRMFDRAERAGYDPDECAARRWDCWMLLGDFESAWRESAAIAARGNRGPIELWDGAPLDGHRVMIRCLHGLGDAIQFIRYASQLRPRVERIVVETHPELTCLLRHVPGVDEVITWGETSGGNPPQVPVEWDSQIEVTELPRYFRTTLATIPREVPYIRVPASVAASGVRRRSPKTGLKVGLLWESSTWNPARSMPLAALEPLLAMTGMRFHSLQRGDARRQLADFKAYDIEDTSLTASTILDTAADICALDLVITVDTMVAHLAGALGKPVWTLLPFEADWRWMLDRDDSPWYPTMRLFRQLSPGRWDSVVSELTKAFVKTQVV